MRHLACTFAVGSLSHSQAFLLMENGSKTQTSLLSVDQDCVSLLA